MLVFVDKHNDSNDSVLSIALQSLATLLSSDSDYHYITFN